MEERRESPEKTKKTDLYQKRKNKKTYQHSPTGAVSGIFFKAWLPIPCFQDWPLLVGMCVCVLSFVGY